MDFNQQYLRIFHIVDTVAEQQKHYHKKNKAEVLEQDALRKRLKRVEMKITNPQKNKKNIKRTIG